MTLFFFFSREIKHYKIRGSKKKKKKATEGKIRILTVDVDVDGFVKWTYTKSNTKKKFKNKQYSPYLENKRIYSVRNCSTFQLPFVASKLQMSLVRSSRLFYCNLCCLWA